MRAMFYRRPGPPDVLEYGDLPEPAISDRQILVKVHAAGVNPVDGKMRRLRIRPPWLRFPIIPGSDLAGEVVRVGRKVTRFRPGDPVYAMLSPFSGGACAEYAAVPEDRAARKPANLTFEEAAAVPVAGLAALQALRDLGKVRRDQQALINGASGGVGSFAVQIANAYGARVTAVASSNNIDFVKSLGADRVIDYRLQDFIQSDARYDLIFDTVASRSFRECMPVLSPRGVYVSTLPSAGTILRMVIGPIVRGRRAKLLNVRARGTDLDTLTQLIEAGTVRPYIDRIFPLPKTADAHAYSEAGHTRGKLVIHVSD